MSETNPSFVALKYRGFLIHNGYPKRHHPNFRLGFSRYTKTIQPGWWFGCHQFYVPINIGNFIIPIDELISFRGVALAHQPDDAFIPCLQSQSLPTDLTCKPSHASHGSTPMDMETPAGAALISRKMIFGATFERVVVRDGDLNPNSWRRSPRSK